ncbi:hypothetical protein ACFLU6_08330, partial [Acidobacteriota bacterium]
PPSRFVALFVAVFFLTVLDAASDVTSRPGEGSGPKQEVTAEPGSPAHAMQSLMKAIAEEDVDLYVSLLDSKARAQVQQASKAMGNQYHALMKNQIGKFKRQWEGLSVAGEDINGNSAQVTLSCDDGEKVRVDFIKETGGWKLRLMS